MGSRPTPELARQIAAAGAYSGMSRDQLAAEVGVHAMTVGRWERGDWTQRAPTKAVIGAIAEATGIPPLWRAAGFLNPDGVRPEALLLLAQELVAQQTAEPTQARHAASIGLDDRRAGS